MRARRGVTLIETMISVSVAGFLFLFLGFLTFAATRSAAVVHGQIQAQNSAAMAAERVAAELRNAVGFERFPADAGASGTLSRVRYLIPATGTTLTTRAVRFDEATSQVQILDVDSTGAPILPPRHAFRHLSGLSIQWESEYRLTLSLQYRYRAFALYLEGQGLPQYGHFTTTIIAKNHFMDQGVQNYAQGDNPTSGPATL